MKTIKAVRKLGRFFFWLMWFPFFTIFLGMMNMPAGSYEWTELPLLTRYSTVATGLLMVLSTLMLIGAPILSSLQNNRLLSDGQPAEAAVLEIHDTGTTVNNNPIVRFVLEVRPPGGTPFEAETERLIPRLQVPQVQSGAIVYVMCDPQTKAVAIVDKSEN